MRPIATGWCAFGVVAAIALPAPRGGAQAQPETVSSFDLRRCSLQAVSCRIATGTA